MVDPLGLENYSVRHTADTQHTHRRYVNLHIGIQWLSFELKKQLFLLDMISHYVLLYDNNDILYCWKIHFFRVISFNMHINYVKNRKSEIPCKLSMALYKTVIAIY